MNSIEKYVLWTHIYQPLVCPIKDTGTKHFGKYWILTDNENINGQYLSWDELVEYWDNNPDWRDAIVKPRLDIE